MNGQSSPALKAAALALGAKMETDERIGDESFDG